MRNIILSTFASVICVVIALPAPPSESTCPACLYGKYTLQFNSTARTVPVTELHFRGSVGVCNLTFVLSDEVETNRPSREYISALYTTEPGGILNIHSKTRLPQKFRRAFRELKVFLTLRQMVIYVPSNTIIMYWKNGVSRYIYDRPL
ncbi:hypothetical protein FOL47_006208 [Perkinsus chesapeaki]|uniref:Uncharacterized protein n=1 Tax=Perkinsus chesapeaki TaxID=330153 RepID=A0A7J6LTJ8_PERCH|nr:hypothetical protein FOL47_006208 [Perkinsus chesapeaki]